MRVRTALLGKVERRRKRDRRARLHRAQLGAKGHSHERVERQEEEERRQVDLFAALGVAAQDVDHGVDVRDDVGLDVGHERVAGEDAGCCFALRMPLVVIGREDAITEDVAHFAASEQVTEPATDCDCAGPGP